MGIIKLMIQLKMKIILREKLSREAGKKFCHLGMIEIKNCQ